jgi:hypothetical protein
LSDSFPIQNSLKQGDALTPLLFNFVLENAIRNADADDVNLLGDNIDSIKKKQKP